MKTQMNKLYKERDQLMERVKKIDNAIKAFGTHINLEAI